MKLNIRGEKTEITDAMRSYAEEKIGKALSCYDQIQSIEVVLNVTKNPSVAQGHSAEVLCKMPAGSIQAEESAESMYASIDLLSDKLLRQVKKVKDKSLSSNKASIRTDSVEEETEDDEIVVVEAISED